MAKFEVIFVESYEHRLIVEANSYLEAEEKADRMLTVDTTSYCDPEPSWFLESVEKFIGEKKSRKQVSMAA